MTIAEPTAPVTVAGPTAPVTVAGPTAPATGPTTSVTTAQAGTPGPQVPVRPVGRPARFTTQDAVRAALRTGIADFTMSDVARTLGVTTPAIYRLFPGRPDLVTACVRHIATELPDAAGTAATSWREVLEDAAGHLWQLFTRYPGLDLVLSAYPGLLRELWPAADLLQRRLEPFGFSPAQSTFATDHVGALTVAATTRLQRRCAEFTRPAGSVPPPREFRARGLEITDLDGLTASSHDHWWQCITLFLDRLAVLAPDWPDYPS